MRTVLVDGDIVSYRVGFACEHKLYYCVIDDVEMVFEGKKQLNDYLKAHDAEDVEWQSELKVEPVKFALSTAKNALHNIFEATKADAMEIYLTGSGNFRNDIATVMKYKGNRDDKRRAIRHADIIEYLIKNHDAVVVDGMEADDILATRQLEATKAGMDTVIASDDKDLMQVPGKHFNIRTGARVTVSEDTASFNKHRQMLIGDTSDNIPGIPGYGEVKAEKVLSEVSPSQYRNTVETHWHSNLANPTKQFGLPKWLNWYNPESTVLNYLPWNSDMQMEVPLSDFLDELEALVTIGVPNGRRQA